MQFESNFIYKRPQCVRGCTIQSKATQEVHVTSRSVGEEELQFKKTLDVDVRRVLEGKRLLLFKEMAADANVGDETLFQELTEGSG